MMLIAVLVWGAVAFTKLGQQEDPTFPRRTALVVNRLPGATALQIEQLVSEKIEKKISELDEIEEIKSQSRAGVSVITVKQVSAREQRIDQGWDKIRAKLQEVKLPTGASVPHLDTSFGNTVTLLFAITSPKISPEECIARATVVRNRLGELRGGVSSTNRAAVAAFFPPSVAQSYRAVIQQKFLERLEARRLGSEPHARAYASFLLADFATQASKAEIQEFLVEFRRQMAGSDAELHPDFGPPLVLMGDEDPLPAIQATAMPRYSYRDLQDQAETFEDELKQLESVGRVQTVGTVSEAVYLIYSIPNVAGRNLSSLRAVELLAARNALIPGGTFRAGGQNYPVQLTGEFKSEDKLQDWVVGQSREGAPVYVRDVFEVRRGYENPIPFNVDVLTRLGADKALESQRSVLVAVEMKDGQIIRHFNEEVGNVAREVEKRFPDGMHVVTLSDQPTAVDHRVRHFIKCFVEAVIIVVVMALLLMDWRAALVVALGIPLTVAMTTAALHALSIPLHQISIAALIIALGMLVDDPVVASDAINRELAHGQPRGVAAWLGPYRLRHAIFFGTLINIVAFLPLVLLPGDKGVFILALPVVVTLTLVSSRIVSMTFVPLLGYYLLRGQKGLEAGGELRQFFLFRPVDQALAWLLPRYRRTLTLALERPWKFIGVAYGLLALSFGLTAFFGTQFFPPAERNQFLIDVELPASASIFQTRQVCQQIAERLRQQEGIESAGIFVGGSAPRFYYNVAPKEQGNYLAQVLVNTRQADQVLALIARLREEFDRDIPGARCLVKQLEQGVPVESPIQVRLTGDDLDVLRELADQTAAILRKAGGYKVNDDLGLRMPTLKVDIDQDKASTLGIDNAVVGRVMQSAFAGVKVSDLREGDHLIPLVIRLNVEERSEAEKMRSLYVESAFGRAVPLDSFARIEVDTEFATIARFNQLRAATVRAYSRVGELPSAVLARAKPGLRKLILPPGYKLEFAGEAQELKKSQAEMGLVMKVSLSLIALAMVIQFRSVTKSLVVMLVVPLGLIGAFVGMTIMHTSLGFMALLGIVSLAGVIVSHIIVLSDFIEVARAEGMELKRALIQAGLVRLRAVLVTVLATVGGLIPLALTGGELWRPLTAVHIFGLLCATGLTLIMLPALYYVFCARLKWIK